MEGSEQAESRPLPPNCTKWLDFPLGDIALNIQKSIRTFSPREAGIDSEAGLVGHAEPSASQISWTPGNAAAPCPGTD